MAEFAPFRALHGEYVENSGQVLDDLRGYLDYFEPLGSALARLPDGVGGPFLFSFTDSGGRTIGTMGWVVSAASKRFGGWKLWGMWCEQPVPAVALPLFWNALSDPSRVSDLVARANADAVRLLDRHRWPELLDEVRTARLHDDAFRDALKLELARAWSVPPPDRHSLEVELTPRMLDLLPWLYLLGPVDPAAAQLQPSRFNGPGYQYILSEQPPPPGDVEVPEEIAEMVDVTASDVYAGWQNATNLRALRVRPRTREPRTHPLEAKPMRNQPSPRERTTARKPPSADWRPLVEPLFQLAVLALLGWIAYNVHLMRKALEQERAAPAAVSQELPAAAETVEPDDERTRIRRIAAALAADPFPDVRVNDAVLRGIGRNDAKAEDTLARIGVEIFLRRNRCLPRADAVDGTLSAAELRAARGCAVLQDARLMKNGTDPDVPRAIAWLERAVAAPR